MAPKRNTSYPLSLRSRSPRMLSAYLAPSGRPPGPGEVLGSVHFEDDSLAMGQEEQEVHAESQQGFRAALADCPWVPVQPYLGQERREVRHRAAVDLVVELVQIPLRR